MLLEAQKDTVELERLKHKVLAETVSWLRELVDPNGSLARQWKAVEIRVRTMPSKSKFPAYDLLRDDEHDAA